VQLCGSLSILWHCLSLGLERKLTFSSPVATAEYSKFAGILSAALSQHHLSGFEIAQLEFYFTGWSSKRCPGIGFLSRGDREIGVLRNVEPPTMPRLECLRETGLILRCDRKVGNPFQTKQGSRPSCPDQEGRKGSKEGVPENLSVPLEGDRDFGELS